MKITAWQSCLVDEIVQERDGRRVAAPQKDIYIYMHVYTTNVYTHININVRVYKECGKPTIHSKTSLSSEWHYFILLVRVCFRVLWPRGLASLNFKSSFLPSPLPCPSSRTPIKPSFLPQPSLQMPSAHFAVSSSLESPVYQKSLAKEGLVGAGGIGEEGTP